MYSEQYAHQKKEKLELYLQTLLGGQIMKVEGVVNRYDENFYEVVPVLTVKSLTGHIIEIVVSCDEEFNGAGHLLITELSNGN